VLAQITAENVGGPL